MSRNRAVTIACLVVILGVPWLCGTGLMNRNRAVTIACLVVILGVPWLCGPEAGPDGDYVTPGVGWVCLDGECRRPSDAWGLRAPGAVERDAVYLFTYARADGSVDYFAAPTRAGCETMRERYEDVTPSACREGT